MLREVSLVLFMIFALLLSSCSFVHGFTQMDDQWCTKHTQASQWRCWDHASRN